MDYKSIEDIALGFEDGLENASGIQEKAYFIPSSYIQTWGKPAADGTTAESLVTIATDHVLVAGKAPIQLDVLFDKSGVTGSMDGEIMSGVFQATLETFMPQLSAKNLGSAGAIKNFRGIVLFKRTFGGDWLQIGSEEILARPIPGGTFGTGVGPTGEPGIRVNFQGHSHMPLFVYTGEFPAPAAP